MNRGDLQKLAELRIKEARVLLDNDCFEGAYYLAGYAVECALKACIAKQTKQYDFPDKKLVNQIYKHDPTELMKAAGLETELKEEIKSNREFSANWKAVSDWSEENRYQADVSKKTANDLYSAITDTNSGVLQWLKKWW